MAHRRGELKDENPQGDHVPESPGSGTESGMRPAMADGKLRHGPRSPMVEREGQRRPFASMTLARRSSACQVWVGIRSGPAGFLPGR
jgi:hypothetical protein